MLPISKNVICVSFSIHSTAIQFRQINPPDLMQVNFIAQPQQQLGNMLQSALASTEVPVCVTIVSAFASLQAVLRLKPRLLGLQAGTTAVRIVVGVDMGGTSKEVLKELATWPIDVFVFKNRKAGVIFHPKLYVIESSNAAEIFLGSNNLTDGGLYRNYEGAVQVTYDLPADVVEFEKAKNQLDKFIEPAEPIGRRLDAKYLAQLIARKDIPSEVESRQRRKVASGEQGATDANVAVYGYEPTDGSPTLPIEVKEVVLAAVRQQLAELDEARKKARRAAKEAKKHAAAAMTEESITLPALPQEVDIQKFQPMAQIAPTAFYLQLVATKGDGGKIPGEQRIPLDALHVAQEFFGWPENYTESVNPRKGADADGDERVYLNWKPVWRVHSVSDSTKEVVKDVRMYFYKNSSDFRFYSGALAKWAQAGDMVRITRCDDDNCIYDCALAVEGTPENAEWKALCSAGSAHTDRLFGFS